MVFNIYLSFFFLLKFFFFQDIESYILEILNATGTQFAHRRYALSLKLSLPVMIMPEIRVIAVIQRMMELAIEVDLPLTFEFVGYVWWDFGCSPSPTCKGIWYPPNNANWEDVVGNKLMDFQTIFFQFQI